jgi:hypothetical protein
MVNIQVYSYQRDSSVTVDVTNVSDAEYSAIKQNFLTLLTTHKAYQAISNGFVYAVNLCPKANPSDVWQHIIYRIYMDKTNNEQSWKRASGQGFEEAFASIYNPRLAAYGIKMVVLNKTLAEKALKEMDLSKVIEPSKMDIAIEGNCSDTGFAWKIFGVVHAKTSIAERIKDDAPASRIIMKKGLLSLAATLDSKSFPPPHGDGINHGELGGRTIGSGLKENQPKRNYFEKDGDFSNGYSFNLRTPESPDVTPSGSRIKTLSFSEQQPDVLVQDIVGFWKKNRGEICKLMPTSTIL